MLIFFLTKIYASKGLLVQMNEIFVKYSKSNKYKIKKFALFKSGVMAIISSKKSFLLFLFL